MITAARYHDFCAGHRVYGHENKCSQLHGHNYRVHFAVAAEDLDNVGRVVDFSVIKHTLCEWLEEHWDHKMLLWTKDPLARYVLDLDKNGVVLLSFNPTAENMAQFLVEELGPAVLPKGVTLISARVEETRKCSATYTLDGY